MAGPGSGAPEMSPELVAPMAAFLAHEACPVSGEIYAAGAGRFARMFIASTDGYVHPGPEPTVEDVAANWATINDETGYSVPADLMDWSSHLHGPPAAGRRRPAPEYTRAGATRRAGRAARPRSSRRGAGTGATRRVPAGLAGGLPRPRPGR